MNNRLLISLIPAIALLATGCAQSPHPNRVQSALDKLEMLEAVTRDLPGDAVDIVQDPAGAQCQRIVAHLDSPAELKALFESCHTRQEALTEWSRVRYPDQIKSINVYWTAKECIAARLADIPSPQAIAVLIDLARDPRWQNEVDTTEGFTVALIHKGYPALAQLRECHRHHPTDESTTNLLRELEQHIQ